MRAHVRHTVIAIVAMLAGCSTGDNSGVEIRDQDQEIAQFVAAAEAVTKDTEVDAVTVIAGWERDARKDSLVREALGFPLATCELEECVRSDIAVARLGIRRRPHESGQARDDDDEDQVVVFVSRTVPMHQEGRSWWHTENFRVDLRKTSEGWIATNVVSTGES